MLFSLCGDSPHIIYTEDSDSDTRNLQIQIQGEAATEGEEGLGLSTRLFHSLMCANHDYLCLIVMRCIPIGRSEKVTVEMIY